ncbi:MAG: SGNH/GDSL hydrolase family protein [Algoriphagus aquaeductus]|uniref:SGNH/GDSL hydrolase family protein n=1 Tax=Algoriphagus aquaeductus TaxID=475299 RepID=UPI00391D94D5
MTWVAIGDSITYLNDHPEETGNRISKGYLSLVKERFPNLEVVNKGYNGWTAVRIAEEFAKLEIPKAEVYSIFLGTNDWWRGNPLGTIEDYKNASGPSTVAGSFREIVHQIRNLNPQAKIILITPMKRVDFVYINDFKNEALGSYRDKNGQSLESFADLLKAIFQLEGMELVDLYHQKGMDHADLVKYKRLKDSGTGEYKNFHYPDFIDIPFDPEKDEYPYPVEAIDVTYDGLHPSDKGYRMIAGELVPIFKRIME